MPAADPTSATPIDDTPTTPRAVDPIAPVAAADGKPPKVPVNRETLRQAARLFGYLLPYRGRFIAAMVALVCSTSLGLCFPYLIGTLIDIATRAAAAHEAAAAGHAAAAAAPAAGVPALPGMFVGTGPAWLRGLGLNGIFALLMVQLTIQSAFTYLQVTWFNEAGEKALVQIRRDTYARLIALPMTFFSRRRVGELSSRISADLTQIEDTLTGATPQFLRQSTLLLGGVGFVFFTSGHLALVMLACFPPIIVVAILFGKKMRGVSRAAQDRLAESNTVVEETLQGIANVKAFSNEPYEIARYTASIRQFLDAVLRGVSYRAAFVAFIIFAMFGAIVVVMWYGCILVQRRQLSVGELTRFTIYTSFVAGAIGSFADLYSQIQKTVGATARVRELLLEDPEPVVPPEALPSANARPLLAPEAAAAPVVGTNGAPPARLRGAVEFAGVDFAYPSRPEVQVLHDLSLRAEPGERVALVGPSGAGKSTIVSLLVRFYEPDGGTVLLDGRPAADYPLRALRGQMAIVPQEVLLFGGSVAENIAYGKPGASAPEIAAAARQANAHEFIESFPEGYGTVVGERGIKLSGGQRQRIAIARAILKDPAILILDEATSALDSESERLVQDALDHLMRGRTSFIIAHRLATVREADRIVVIRDGSVAESGTHAELLENQEGLYRRLSEFQFDLGR